MSKNKSFDIIQNTFNSKGYKSMKDALIDIMKIIYNNDERQKTQKTLKKYLKIQKH